MEFKVKLDIITKVIFKSTTQMHIQNNSYSIMSFYSIILDVYQ